MNILFNDSWRAPILQIIVAGLMMATVCSGQQEIRGLRVVQAPDGKPAQGINWLVLIAVDQYMDWPNLRGPVKDAQALQSVLTRRYLFDEEHTIRLYDGQATKSAIIKCLQWLNEKVTAKDSLLIYYAGHGFTDPFSATGYWVPHDGSSDRIDKGHWIPNAEIRGYMKTIRANHVLIVADSCFSGDILDIARESPAELTENYYLTAFRYRSRQVLTSGNSQPVSDSSAFSFHLVDALERNTEPYLDPMVLYLSIRRGVAPPQLPLLGALADAGHQSGGAYIFYLRREFVHAAPKAAAALQKPQKFKISLNTFGGDDACMAEAAPARSEYAQGEKVTFSARPSRDYLFEGWSGSLDGWRATQSVAMYSDLHVTAVFHRKPPVADPAKPIAVEPARITSPPAPPSDWGISVLGGFSAATGVAGGELQWQNFALCAGYLPNEPIVGGLKLYAEPHSDSVFLGIVGAYKNETEDRGKGRMVGLVAGYRLQWYSHITLVLGIGGGIFREDDKSEVEFMLLPDIALGVSF
ncbi:MAG: caspase family protein [Kiritimatiellia bacterium]